MNEAMLRRLHHLHQQAPWSYNQQLCYMACVYIDIALRLRTQLETTERSGAVSGAHACRVECPREKGSSSRVAQPGHSTISGGDICDQEPIKKHLGVNPHRMMFEHQVEHISRRCLNDWRARPRVALQVHHLEVRCGCVANTLFT